MQNKLFKNAFWILMLTGVLNLIANKFYLYWSNRYFDIPMHFLGGLWVTLTVLWIWSQRKNFTPPGKLNLMKVGILSAIIVGILWEIYELYFGITFVSDGVRYWSDTVSDLIMDYVGAVFGSLYAFKLLQKQNNE